MPNKLELAVEVTENLEGLKTAGQAVEELRAKLGTLTAEAKELTAAMQEAQQKGFSTQGLAQFQQEIDKTQARINQTKLEIAKFGDDATVSFDATGKSWKQFTATYMSQAMKMTGSHGAAMRLMGEQWRLASSGAQQAAETTAAAGASMAAATTQAAVATGNLKASLIESQIAAQVMASTIGIQLPMGMSRFIAHAEGLQSALRTAFNASIIVGFGVVGGQALARAAVALTEYESVLERVRKRLEDLGAGAAFLMTFGLVRPPGLARELKKEAEEQERKNRRERGAALAERIRKRDEETRLIGLEGPELIRAQQMQALQELLNRRQQEGLTSSETIKEAQSINTEFNKKLAVALRKDAEQYAKNLDALFERLDALRAKEGEVALQEQRTLKAPGIKTAEVTAGLGGVRPEVIVAAGERVKQIRATQEEIVRLEEDANVARLQGNQRLMAQIALQERRRLEEFTKLLKEGIVTEEEYQRARSAIATDAETERMEVIRNAQEEQQRLVKDTARDWESMYDRITEGAHNMGDVLGNIWEEIKRAWKRQIFEMLAAWALGQRQLAGAGAQGMGTGAAGGIFGGLAGILGPLAGIFGAGAAGGSQAGISSIPGVITNFGPDVAGNIGFGSTGAAPQATQAAGMGLPANLPIGDLLSKVFSRGIGPAGGAQLALGGLTLAGLTYGRGSLIGGLGGLAGGAAAGFAVGGPIGAIVGGIIGGIAGIFGGDKKKEHDAEIENQGFAAIKQLLEEYSRHRIDYVSTFEGYQEIHGQMQAAFVRSESKKHERYWFDRYIEQLQTIEDERNRRRELLGGLAIPEFHSGGLVGWLGQSRSSGISQEEIPAMLERGEFVVSQRATKRWGTLLEKLNAGLLPSSDGGESSSDSGYVMRIWTPSKAWAAKIVEEGIPVVIGSGGVASRMLRQ